MTVQAGNGLRELEAKIKGLPDQKALVRRNHLFLSAQQEARQRLSEFQATQQQIKVLRVIKADATMLADAEASKLSSTRAKASELLNVIEKADPDTAKLGEKLEAIKRAAKSLSEDARSAWALMCEEQRAYAAALRPLAERLSPSLTQRIRELDRLLALGASIPPTSMDAALRLVGARKALDAEVASLNLDAPIVKFIQDAQMGIADPKALFDPQVRGYLDANPALWKSLRVTLI